RLARAVAAPAGVYERPLALHDLAEPVVRDATADAVLLAPRARGGEHVILDRAQQRRELGREMVQRDGLFGARIASHDHGLRFVQIAGTELDAQRHTAQLPFVVFGAGLHRIARVDVHAHAAAEFFP